MLSGLAIAVGLTAFAVTLMSVEMEQRSDAVLDPLTGLLNRNTLDARFEEIAQQAALADGSVCLLACDLDHFKQVNDVHGHETGDRVLKETAYVMRKHLRSFELVYRMGGEEFLIVLPGASEEQGSEIAERVRAGVETGRPCGLDVTVSVGVAAASGHEVVFETLFRAADAMLYEAKRSGRNRVVAERHAGRSPYSVRRVRASEPGTRSPGNTCWIASTGRFRRRGRAPRRPAGAGDPAALLRAVVAAARVRSARARRPAGVGCAGPDDADARPPSTWSRRAMPRFCGR